MDYYDSCYCCPQPSASNKSTKPASSDMDLDSALNELGMLSTVTEGRKQYLLEKELRARKEQLIPRNRNLSDPTLAGAGTPSNSPTKGIYQIVQLNSQFVTSLSSGLFAQVQSSSSSSPCGKPDPTHSTARERLNFGERYKQEELEQDARANRLSRLKIARVKRFRRPYELPWRQSMEHTYNGGVPAPVDANNISGINRCMSEPSPSVINMQEKPCPAERLCNSNASTPEKNPRSTQLSSLHTVTRSKSLDDLDLTKLQLEESEGQNFIQERKDIETVSRHLQHLHVKE